MRDTSKHQGLRNQLANVLNAKGILDENVLNAVRKIPRHLFIDSSFESHAYQDKAFPIAADQTISMPYTVAFQSQTLEVKPGEKVLEIGTGSGYQTAILVKLKAKVYTIERQHDLFRKAIKRLPLLGYEPELIQYGDGYLGIKEHAPYDKIIITAGAIDVPKKLLLQLKIGGIMVIPVGKNIQEMTCIKRISKNKFEKELMGKFNFVPMLKNTN